MKLVPGKGQTKQDTQKRERNGLLAKVHVAKKQLGLSDDQYEAVLRGFEVASARDMTIPQLEQLVKYFRRLGFRPIKARWLKPPEKRKYHGDGQVIALWKRAREIAADIDGGTARLQGLVKKICGVEILEWCRDEDKLERLLKVLGEIRERG
jgi:phage gp16-like protein